MLIIHHNQIGLRYSVNHSRRILETRNLRLPDYQLPFINGINDPRIPLIDSPLIPNNVSHRHNEHTCNLMAKNGNEQDVACDFNKNESQSSSSNNFPSRYISLSVNSVYIDIYKTPNYDQKTKNQKMVRPCLRSHSA